MLIFHIITAEPEVFPGILNTSLIGKAKGKAWDIKLYNLRDYGIGKHKKIDCKPYGGGPGLIIRADVIASALNEIILNNSIDAAYYLSPKGILLKQPLVFEIIKAKNIILLCGRFEGIDERVIKRYNLIEISIGDYILTNGDIAAMILMDTAIRLLPDVIGNTDSIIQDSFSSKDLHNTFYDYPSYTKPKIFDNMPVPEVLFSGNHAKIAKWRNIQSKLHNPY